MDERIIIIGAGGHARPVIESARVAGFDLIGVVDINYKGQKENILSVDVLGGFEYLESVDKEVNSLFLAIGDNKKRREIYEEYNKKGFKFATIIHPDANVSKSAKIGKGSLISVGATIGAESLVGDNVIVNTGTIIDHNSIIGNHSHIAPGCSIAGKVSIGKLVFVGIGSAIIDNIKVGERTVIGAGTVVIKDLEKSSVYVGNPARKIKGVDK